MPQTSSGQLISGSEFFGNFYATQDGVLMDGQARARSASLIWANSQVWIRQPEVKAYFEAVFCDEDDNAQAPNADIVELFQEATGYYQPLEPGEMYYVEVSQSAGIPLSIFTLGKVSGYTLLFDEEKYAFYDFTGFANSVSWGTPVRDITATLGIVNNVYSRLYLINDVVIPESALIPENELWRFGARFQPPNEIEGEIDSVAARYVRNYYTSYNLKDAFTGHGWTVYVYTPEGTDLWRCNFSSIDGDMHLYLLLDRETGIPQYFWEDDAFRQWLSTTHQEKS